MKFIFYLVTCLIFVSQIHAKIVINEFLADVENTQDESLDEWVELYNLGEETIDLKGYLLLDEKSNELVITEKHLESETQIEPYEFKVIRRNKAKFSLNNSSDIIYLFDSTVSAEPIDMVAYESPQTNRSWGRVPDGSGEFVADLEASPGTENKAPAKPTPTSTSSSLKDNKSSDSTQIKRVLPSISPVTQTTNIKEEPKREVNENEVKTVYSTDTTVEILQTEEDYDLEKQLESSQSSEKFIVGVLSSKPNTINSEEGDVLGVASLEVQETRSYRKIMYFFIGSFCLITASIRLGIKRYQQNSGYEVS